jgi:hypothetical protein
MAASAITALMTLAGAAHAGPVFLTGHDPDFHAQDQVSGQDILRTALNFVTGGTYNTGAEKFLFVESNLAPTAGHRVGRLGLSAIGLTQGVNYDQVNAAGLASADFADYSAIVVASDFGGMLTDAEINELVARSNDIKTFVNGGGGLAAFAECGVGFGNCVSDLVTPTTPLFGFVPIGVSSANTTAPYNLTPFGLSLGLTPFDVNDCCTHNSFANSAGLKVVDFDQTGIPTTLAGNVQIGGGGFTGTPEPTAWTLMILGFGLAGAALRRRVARPA